MKRKSDKAKLKEGRCLGKGKDYVGFLKANEAKSIGTACMIYDPIADRTVDVLSTNEKYFFWLLRYRDDVEEIKEQMLMNTSIVEDICKTHGFRIPTNVLSTDFLVTFIDGSSRAYSVKTDRDEFNPDSERYRVHPEKYKKLLIRQTIELEYWRRHGTDFQIVFGNELNRIYARNIEICMGWYDKQYVTDTESKLHYLLAHKILEIPMNQVLLKFAQLARTMEKEIERKYEEAERCVM